MINESPTRNRDHQRTVDVVNRSGFARCASRKTEERFGCQILGECTVTGPSEQEAEHERFVKIEQFLEAAARAATDRCRAGCARR